MFIFSVSGPAPFSCDRTEESSGLWVCDLHSAASNRLFLGVSSPTNRLPLSRTVEVSPTVRPPAGLTAAPLCQDCDTADKTQDRKSTHTHTHRVPREAAWWKEQN